MTFPVPRSKREQGCVHADADDAFLPRLDAAWKALLAALKPQSLPTLSCTHIAELLVKPLAAALKHRSEAVCEMTKEFWSSSGIQVQLGCFDVRPVESAMGMLMQECLHEIPPLLRINSLCELEVTSPAAVCPLTACM